MSLRAANGTINVTVVSGASYTGIYAADGSFNVIKAPGGTYVGLFHPCGAQYVTLSTGTLVPYYAPDGSMYVNDLSPINTNSGLPITVVSGTLHPGGGSIGVPMGLLLALTYSS